MVPVKDDSWKHLTHKNEFFARAKRQPKVIHSFEMLREMEREVRKRGVTGRAMEQDRARERTKTSETKRGRELKLRAEMRRGKRRDK